MFGYNLLETIVIFFVGILNFGFFFSIFGIILYKLFKVVSKTPETLSFWFFIRYLIYVSAFSIYNLVIIILMIFLLFNPAVPVVFYVVNRPWIDSFINNTPIIANFINFISNHPQNRLIGMLFFINFVLFGWFVLVLSPFKLENPLDFNNPKKTNFLTRFLDKLLNFFLKVRPEIDLKKYQLELDINLQNNLKFDKELLERLERYESFRFKHYLELFKFPLQKRFFLEIVIGCLLLVSGVIGFWLYPFENTGNSDLDDFFILLYFFGMIFLFIFFYVKRRNINFSKKNSVVTEKLTKSYLPLVQNRYKTEILNYIFSKSVLKRNAATSYLLGEELKQDQFLNSSHNNFKVSDFLESQYANLDIKFYDLKTSPIDSKKEELRESSGIYIKTSFQEKFKGVIFVTTKNKKFFTKQLVNYPDIKQSLKFETESLDFNLQFSVYTRNQIEARLALKTNIMYALLQLANLNKNIYLKLESNSAYLFLETEKDFFEYDYFAKQRLSSTTTFNSLQNEIYNQYQLPIIISLLLNPRKKAIL